MVAVVERGTGMAAALPGVRVAGKTGDRDQSCGKIARMVRLPSRRPADAPRVAVAIVVENGGYGGDVAAPIARRAIAAALQHERN